MTFYRVSCCIRFVWRLSAWMKNLFYTNRLDACQPVRWLFPHNSSLIYLAVLPHWKNSTILYTFDEQQQAKLFRNSRLKKKTVKCEHAFTCTWKKQWNSDFPSVTPKSQTRQLKQELETTLHFLAPLGTRISFGWSTHLTPSPALPLVSLPHTWWNVLIAPIFPCSLKWSWKARDPQLKLLSSEAIGFGVELLSFLYRANPDWNKRMSINLWKWKCYPHRNNDKSVFLLTPTAIFAH